MEGIVGGASAGQTSDLDALSSLAELHAALLTAQTADEIAEAALDFVRGALGAERGSVQVAEDGGPLRLRRCEALSDRFRAALERGCVWPRDLSPASLADEPAREPLTVINVGDASAAGPPASTIVYSYLLNEGIQAAAVMPLAVPGQLLGVLAAYWNAPRALAEDELRLLTMAGGQIGLALDRLARVHHHDDESRARLATIVDSSDDAIIGKDLDTIITSWNPGAQRLYGYTAAEVVGRPISLLIPPDRPDELPAIMERLKRGERIEHYETQRVRRDGARLDVSVSISPIKDSAGRIIGAASVARDITVRRLEEQRHLEVLAREQAARARAERAVNRTARLQLITEGLAQALTVAEIAQVLIERGLPGVGAVAGSVGLLSDDGKIIEVIGALGYPEPIAREFQRQPVAGATPLAEAVRAGVPIWRELDGTDDERFGDFLRRAQAYPSGAALPLIADGRVIGAIGLSFHEQRTFNEDERGFMLTLAGQCAQAVQRVRLYENERASREQLDAILGGVVDGVLVQRADGSFAYANDAAARMAGFDSAADYLSASASEISRRLTVLDADGQPLPHEELPSRRAPRGEEAPERVIHYRREDTGEARWTRTRSRTVRGVGGELLAISLFHDVTDEVRSRERLRFLAEAGSRLASTLEVDETLTAIVQVASTTLADWAVVLLVDEDGRVQHLASAHRDPSKDPLIGELHERHLQHASQARLLWRAIQTGEAILVPEVSLDMMAQTELDPERLALLQALGISSLLYAPLVGPEGVQGAIALFMAESRRRFGEEDRAIAIEIARRASLALDNARLYRQTRDAVHARDEFLSIASHELRTPVTAISGVAQLALRSYRRGTLDDARLARVLEQLVRGSQRLATLTEDLLDVSRLQSGRFELRLELLDVPSFVIDLVERYRANLGERHTLVLKPDNESLVVRADSARLEQVLANLLGNAIKYSPEGGSIVVAVSRDGAGVRVGVRDAGIGLPPGTEETIFQAFGRAPNAAHRQIQGLGLGLFICRQIMDRHGGRIWAESPGEDQGTTLQIWLPLAEGTGNS
jgi:PAS domain S-box-containing protein